MTINESDNVDFFMPLYGEVGFTVFLTILALIFCKPCTTTVFIVWWVCWEIGFYAFSKSTFIQYTPYKGYKYIWWRRAAIVSSSFIAWFSMKYILLNRQ